MRRLLLATALVVFKFLSDSALTLESQIYYIQCQKLHRILAEADADTSRSQAAATDWGSSPGSLEATAAGRVGQCGAVASVQPRLASNRGPLKRASVYYTLTDNFF